MTDDQLLETFAGHALSGLLAANSHVRSGEYRSNDNWLTIARSAYDIAEVMMALRAHRLAQTGDGE